jgi:hypothetical protein
VSRNTYYKINSILLRVMALISLAAILFATFVGAAMLTQDGNE